jgi:hypothetical protein
MGTLSNPEPGRAYVFANAEDGVGQNYQYYEMLGYRMERKTKGGVQVVQGQKVKEGEPLRFWDQVLMSCSEERKAEIDEFGPHGNTGRRLAKRIQEKINSAGLQEGVGRRTARVVNETTPLMVEG